MNQLTTKERLPLQREKAAAAPMAARAVALCEGCPMAKFCVIKEVAPCETPLQRGEQIESGGGESGGSALDKPLPPRTSYREALMDDSVPFVMANLQKKKETALPRPQPAPPRPVVTRPPKHTAAPSPTPARPVASPTKKVPMAERRSGTSDIVADILVSLFGVQSLTSARVKKGV